MFHFNNSSHTLSICYSKTFLTRQNWRKGQKPKPSTLKRGNLGSRHCNAISLQWQTARQGTLGHGPLLPDFGDRKTMLFQVSIFDGFRRHCCHLMEINSVAHKLGRKRTFRRRLSVDKTVRPGFIPNKNKTEGV